MGKRIIAAAVALLLLIGYIVADRYWEKRKEDRKKEETKLFDVKADDVSEIVLQKAKEEEIVLVKEGEKTWKMTRPVMDLADESTVRSMTSKIEELNYDRVIEEKPEDLKSYGFDPYLIRIGFKSKGKDALREFHIGEKSPVGYFQYIRIADAPRILLVSSSVRSVYDRDLLSLRNKEVFKIDREKVQFLRFKSSKSGGEVGIRKSSDTWSSESDPSLSLDQEAIKNLVRDLVNIRIREFDEEHPKSLSKYGLDKPSASYFIEWGTEGGGVTGETITVGNKVKDKDRFYANQGSRSVIFEIDKYSVDSLNKSLHDLKEKHPIRFNRFDLTGLEIVAAGRTYELAKAEGVWSIEKPEKAKAKADVVSDLLILLEDAEGKEIFAAAKPEHGFASPNLSLVMKEKEKVHPRVVFGNIILKDNKDNAYVKNEATGVVYLVEAARIKDILRGIEDLKAPAQPEGDSAGD